MLYTLRFPLQNAVCFIMLTCLVPVLFTFYIQDVLKLKKNNSSAKELTFLLHLLSSVGFFSEWPGGEETVAVYSEPPCFPPYGKYRISRTFSELRVRRIMATHLCYGCGTVRRPRVSSKQCACLQVDIVSGPFVFVTVLSLDMWSMFLFCFII